MLEKSEVLVAMILGKLFSLKKKFQNNSVIVIFEICRKTESERHF